MTQPKPSSDETVSEIERLHEREKSLIGYDLHDGVAQLIIGAKMNLESISKERLSEQDNQKISDAKQYLTDAISDLRHMIGDLRASSIEPEMVILELESLIERYRSEDRSIDFLAEESFSELPSSICGAIYRIIQESLNNIQKHSRATKVKIILQCHDNRSRLCIVDNGIGMVEAFSNKDPQIESFGLSGISFRATVTGGQSRFFSKAINPLLSVGDQDSREPLRVPASVAANLLPMDQWLTDVSNSKMRKLFAVDFCFGTLVEVQWPIPV